MKTAEVIKNNEIDILHRYGFSITKNKHIDCPLCKSKKSFRIHTDMGNVRFICKCSTGNVTKLILETSGKSVKEFYDEIDLIYGNRPEFRSVSSLSKSDEAMNEFNKLGDIEFSVAEHYFNSRGILKMPHKNIKFCPSVYHKESDKELNTIVAIATDDNGKATYKHETYVTSKGKANVDPSRKMHKIVDYPGNSAIRMFEHSGVLGLSEGIESALSAHQIDGLPVWATINTSLLKKFKAPQGVHTLVIYADNDVHGAGLAAAFSCANKNLMSNNNVTTAYVRWLTKHNDFNDYITNGRNDKVMSWKLTR